MATQFKDSFTYDDFKADTFFHPAMMDAGIRRMKHEVAVRFAHIPVGKRFLLHCIISRTIRLYNESKTIILEAFGDVIYKIKNIGPNNGKACIINLEDHFLQAMHAPKLDDDTWIDGAIFVSCMMIGAVLSYAIMQVIPR
jgi:hypothetical protein